MNNFDFPYKDAEFLLNHVLDFDRLCLETGLEDVNGELVLAILEEAIRFGGQVLAPLNETGDRQGARLEDDGVHETPGFAEAYRQFVDNGWAALVGAEAYGGQAMPKVVQACITEVWYTANVAFSLGPLLTTGAIEALEAHASENLKQTYFPDLVSGNWMATMCLTESAAGSDLAAVTCRAVPHGDHYLLTGQKIFITWGDHRMADNIIHLVLARLPDAPAGVKGISMFLVPKYLLDEHGRPGEQNDVHCVGIEHKLGIHGSPTCTLNFGDNGGAVAYLVGEPHGGLMAMFTMMNDARQGVGQESLGVSGRSYQQAAAFARERIQGTRKDGSRYPIIEFPDVRRMLMVMKSATEAMRGLIYIAAVEIDRMNAAQTTEQARRHAARTGIYTPIVKGWISELAQEVTYLGIQVHGGMGYVEETGSAQHYRDARIMSIYEGTNGIQGLDLAGRKTLGDKGEALDDLLREIRGTAAEMSQVKSLSGMAEPLLEATRLGREAMQWLLSTAPKDRHAAGGASVNYMMLIGYLCGGWVMAKSALKASELLEAGSGDETFLRTKLVTAQFYFDHLLPRTAGYFKPITAGSEGIMALAEDQF
ncbi:MAG: acyl-CoA dehydrogenase [Xanthomonadales bacterium]|nr:acyl-CoA dehydrogenase [Xanthomonadales bacterium]